MLLSDGVWAVEGYETARRNIVFIGGKLAKAPFVAKILGGDAE